MELFFDTTVLVDIDRGDEETVELMKSLVRSDQRLYISAVTVAEIMAGAYREGNPEKARKVLGQFQWKEMKGSTADKTGEIIADLLDTGEPIEFQDVVIAATAEESEADSIITENTEHFRNIRGLETDVKTPGELKEEVL